MTDTPAAPEAAPAAAPALAVPQSTEEAGALASQLIETAIPLGLKALGALAILIVGMWVAGAVRSAVTKAAEKSGKFDATLARFFASLAYYLVVALVVVAVLGQFGVQTTSLAALIGAAGLAVGLALQGTLGHVASGVMLLAFRPFKIGDVVEAGGHTGSVSAITLFTTEMTTPDNKQIIIPNGTVWGGSITNYSAHATRRLDLVFGIAYDADIGKAMAAISSVVDADARALKDPAVTIEVDNLGDSSVDIICRVWCAGSDYFPLKWALSRAVKERFDADGVDIPFPSQTVYHVNPS